MEQQTDAMGMLDLLSSPGFCVKDNIIVKANAQAKSLLIEEGVSVSPLLLTGGEEYAAFDGGCLYLTLDLSGQSFGTSVARMDGFDVFLLEQEDDQAELQAMALAARELREPLANVMATADRLFPLTALQDDPQTRDQVARLNRGLFQMLRVIGNMSDASRYSASPQGNQETRDICQLMGELFEKAEDLVAHTGLTLTFRNHPESVYCLVDSERLERAVMNILSNAIKFTPKGGSIQASLTKRGRKLYLTVQDSGSGIASEVYSSVFRRYLRQPGIEDGRFGIGLGMVLIRSAAAQHGGTVLIDQPQDQGTRITMTIAIRQNPTAMVCSSILRVDYAGERDHGLIELSDCLPAALYDSKKVN